MYLLISFPFYDFLHLCNGIPSGPQTPKKYRTQRKQLYVICYIVSLSLSIYIYIYMYIYIYRSEGFALTGYDIPGCVEDGAWMLWENSSAVAVAAVAHQRCIPALHTKIDQNGQKYCFLY